MRRFFAKKLSKNYYLEFDCLRSFISLNWFPICNLSFECRFKGSHKGLYTSFYFIGFKIFELNIYNKHHDEPYFHHDPILDY